MKRNVYMRNQILQFVKEEIEQKGFMDQNFENGYKEACSRIIKMLESKLPVKGRKER